MSKMTKKAFQDLLSVAMDESRSVFETTIAIKGLVAGVNSVCPGLIPSNLQVTNVDDIAYIAKIIASHYGEILANSSDS